MCALPTAKASNSTVFYRHVLRNAGIVLISVIGIQIGYMLGGSVLIENVFPGLVWGS